jgi:hypothetical protein
MEVKNGSSLNCGGTEKSTIMKGAVEDELLLFSENTL